MLKYMFNLFRNCTDSVVGLSPTGDPLVLKLQTFLTNLGYVPQTFTDDLTFEQYIQSTSYASSKQICFGITVQSSTTGNYSYSLRFNMTLDNTTDGPWTTLPLSQDDEVDYSLYTRTTSQGMLGANNLVHTAILQI